MKYFFKTLLFVLLASCVYGQNTLSPAITSWLQNDSITGTYYINGNSTPIDNNILVNCQKVEYSTDYVYVHTKGVPAYPTGPFNDMNPSQAEDQDLIVQIPLNPQPQSGTKQSTVGGNIGVFINGVALFDYRDGVAWNPLTNALCGGPGNPSCPGGPMAQMDWNRDAIPAELGGFDCSKGHPAMGNYHHHQNPSAFKLDLDVVSSVCDIHDADGLYAIDSTKHAPLLGFAYDGYPVYGAYAFANTDGTGGIIRMKSGYRKRNITVRTHHADGTDVDDGPVVDATYFLGYFREDYEYVADTDPWVMDEHNGRFCVTPDYPNGTYAYFLTVDSLWNSQYPYAVGPTFYGVYANRSVNAVSETTEIYLDTMSSDTTTVSIGSLDNFSDITVFPNPAMDLIAVQINGLVKEAYKVDLTDISGKLVESKQINAGQTISYFDTQALYNGTYFINIYNSQHNYTRKVVVNR